MAWMIARARFATALLFARLARPSSISRTSAPRIRLERPFERRDRRRPCVRSSAAMFSSSAASAIRATASAAVCGSAACRATLLSSFVVVDPAERRRADGVVRRRLGDGRELLLVVEPFERQRRRGVRSAPAAVASATSRSAYSRAQLLVGFRLRELDEVFDSGQAGAGRAPDARRRRPRAPAPAALAGARHRLARRHRLEPGPPDRRASIWVGA